MRLSSAGKLLLGAMEEGDVRTLLTRQEVLARSAAAVASRLLWRRRSHSSAEDRGHSTGSVDAISAQGKALGGGSWVKSGQPEGDETVRRTPACLVGEEPGQRKASRPTRPTPASSMDDATEDEAVRTIWAIYRADLRRARRSLAPSSVHVVPTSRRKDHASATRGATRIAGPNTVGIQSPIRIATAHQHRRPGRLCSTQELFDWVIAAAVEGTLGRHYAAIVIPEDFRRTC